VKSPHRERRSYLITVKRRTESKPTGDEINVEVGRDDDVLLVGVAGSGTAINNRGYSYAGNAVESVNSLSTVC
jgi:hypothetical protein